MIILLHSSKTMRRAGGERADLSRPLLIERAKELAAYLKTLSPEQLARTMQISAPLAEKTRVLLAEWTDVPEAQSPAVDSFVGDIYSGLRANEFSPEDRRYANETLRILSGLYGILRPLDGIVPYRLEMGYKLPDPPFDNLYDYWGETIAACLPAEGPIVNLAAVEYSRVVTRYVNPERIVTPRFLTVNPKTGEPGFVVVHAKIARGAFARWLITRRVRDIADLPQFAELGYRFDESLSASAEPAFVAESFEGKGLSIRLK